MLHVLFNGGMAETSADRLRRVRALAGYETASDAARAYGWKVSTYLAHENGQNGFKIVAAVKYGRAYHVPPGWLLTGEGPKQPKQPKFVPAEIAPPSSSLPIMGYIGAGAVIEPEFEQVPSESLGQVELPFAVPPDLIGLEVRGESMLPRYESGDVIVVWREQRGTAEALLGEEAAVRTSEGQRYLKRLLRGPARGTYNLESTNAGAKTIEAVRLDWWSEVYLLFRRAQIRRIGERERTRQRTQTSRRAAAGTGELPLSKRGPS
jgi:phage repressor protein C with HTH and peptisase S24 domain